MKTIIVACGSGIATSTIICNKVSDLLNENGIDHTIIQCSINEVPTQVNIADLVVSTMPLTSLEGVPKVLGIPFLTGIGAENTKKEILEKLR